MSKKRFLLRLDPKLYAVIEKWAADDLRSVNAQIEYVLRQALVSNGRVKLVQKVLTEVVEEKDDDEKNV